MKRRTQFNDKRRIRESCESIDLERLALQVQYGGNPEHKRNPGDFGLTPPSLPRPDKELCDSVEVFSRAQARDLLRRGIRRGLISEQMRGEFPQNVWSVSQGGIPLEAQLENRTTGTYHGYPMPLTDPFRDEVVRRWQSSTP